MDTHELTNSSDDIFTNPLLLALAVGYIRANRQQLDKETLRKQFVNAGLEPNTVNLLLDDKVINEAYNISKQPDPQPSAILSEQSPSLQLYSILVIFAIVLILVAFIIQPPDWAGLSVNLATEIIGAVIILILVDRRLRNSELRAIREYAESSSVRVASLFSPEVRNAVSYAKAFNAELERIRPKPYFKRPDLEDLLDKYSEGFLVSGAAGIGKSTLLQTIALKQTERVIRHPKSERIPVLFPMRRWTNDGTIIDHIGKQISEYSKLKRKRFHRWLAQGKMIIIFDGIDESMQPEIALGQIRSLKDKYPNTSMIVSCRSHFLARVTKVFDLQSVEMSNLSQAESEAFIHLLYKA